ncbi:MAG: hypothetical protein RLN82_10690, partial [Pseudomonadales bacterium]
MKRGHHFAFIMVGLLLCQISWSQEKVITLSTNQFKSHERLYLAPLDGWIFKQGNDPSWSEVQLSTDDWQSFKPIELTAEMEDASGRLEGWFRVKIKLDKSFEGKLLAISRDL